MRALITGGAGFIGSHLADALIETGHSVIVLDDLSTGSLDNIAHLDEHPRFSFVFGSVEDDRAVDKAMDSCDLVFHLAAAVGVRLVVTRPLHTLRTNVAGTETVLRIAARRRRLVVLASTSEVYGKSAAVPFREDADLVLGPPTKTRWGYATSKLLDEFLALAYAKEHQCPVIVARLFNTVGPRQIGSHGMVLPTFVQCALAGEPLVIHGNGSQTRSFSWVGDVVSALRALCDQPRAVGEVFNIGSDQETRIDDLAGKVKALTGSSSLIVKRAYSDVFDHSFEDTFRRVPDISKLRGMIGFAPDMLIDEMIIRTIDYWTGLRDRPSPALDPVRLVGQNR